MKILIIQLARLGDIYLSWPALRALRRKYPTAEIHMLTRPRFADALGGLKAVDHLHYFQTKEILTPLVSAEPDIPTAYSLLSKEVEALKQNSFDWIVNLSFSPSSSYLTSALTEEKTRVCGYTRFTDGFLKIPDDMSAYFYAQVGTGRANRFHLAEIFASMMELDLIDNDWSEAIDHAQDLSAFDLPEEFIVIHVGASEQKKQISGAKLGAIINQFRKTNAQKIVLVGSPEEKKISDTILTLVPETQVVNLVGQTSLQQLFAICARAKLLVGGDSAPIHMASLTQTPCLNLSLSSVNFWETGPRSPKSFVIKADSEEDFVSDKVAETMNRILKGEKTDLSVAVGIKGTPSYRSFSRKEYEFQWDLLQAVYQGKPFPPTNDPLFLDGIEKLRDVNLLMIEQMEKILAGTEMQKVSAIIDQGEMIIETIGKIVPALALLVRWYQTEKIRIGPDDTKVVLDQTLKVQNLFQSLLEIETWRTDEQVDLQP